MNFKPSLIRADAQSAETINITVLAQDIGETKGSARWLAGQPIVISFRGSGEYGVPCRVAELQIDGFMVPIAAEGACPIDVADDWEPHPGIHDIHIETAWFYDRNSNFKVSLTPGARVLIEKIVEQGRAAFREWIDSDAQAGERCLITSTSV